MCVLKKNYTYYTGLSGHKILVEATILEKMNDKGW